METAAVGRWPGGRDAGVAERSTMTDRAWSERATLSPELAGSLRLWRPARGAVARALAERCGCHGPTVTNLEAGRRAPSIVLAVDLAGALDLNDAEYDRLLVEARRAGRSSPWKTGAWD
jgi:DNA-binding XRE family transcriptional regulator